MVPVSIEGVRRNFASNSVFLYTVTLIDKTKQHIFVFGIERHEAQSIVAALHDLPLPYPPTINVMVDTLKLHGIILEEVRLEHFSTLPPLYYALSATLLWRNSNNEVNMQTLDLRPDDALGLSLLTGSQLLLSDTLAEQIGYTLPKGQTPELCMINSLLKREGIPLPEAKKLRLGDSKRPMCDALVQEFKDSLESKALPFPEEDTEQRKKDFLTFLLRNGA